MGGRHYWSLTRICKKTSDILHLHLWPPCNWTTWVITVSWCLSHVQIIRWAHCQRQVAFFSPQMEELLAHAYQRSLQYERKLSCLGDGRRRRKNDVKIQRKPPDGSSKPPEGTWYFADYGSLFAVKNNANYFNSSHQLVVITQGIAIC